MFDGHNLWVLKPNDFNRGRGVHLFNSLDQLKKLINDYTAGVEVIHQPSQQQSSAKTASLNDKTGQSEETENKAVAPVVSVIRTDIFVIQKYIEQPMLIN